MLHVVQKASTGIELARTESTPIGVLSHAFSWPVQPLGIREQSRQGKTVAEQLLQQNLTSFVDFLDFFNCFVQFFQRTKRCSFMVFWNCSDIRSIGFQPRPSKKRANSSSVLRSKIVGLCGFSTHWGRRLKDRPIVDCGFKKVLTTNQPSPDLFHLHYR